METITMPSGSEVESAAFHPTLPPAAACSTAHAPGVRGRVEHLEEQGMARVRGWKRSLATRGSLLKIDATERVSNANAKVQKSMGTNPVLWAGIAAAAGFGIGLAGRYLHWRRNRPMPELIVIDATC
jgi:hypothetical protein